MHNKDVWSARPVVALTANTAWNLAHFRAPLLRAFAARGAVLVALTPADAAVKKLQDMGCTVAPLPIPAHGRNPWSDVVLFWSYLRLLRRYRPAVLLSFTVKPNIYGGLAARCLGIAQIGNISGLGTAFIEGGWLGRLVGILYRLGLGGARTVFFQNPDDRNFFYSVVWSDIARRACCLARASICGTLHPWPIPARTARIRSWANSLLFFCLLAGCWAIRA